MVHADNGTRRHRTINGISRGRRLTTGLRAGCTAERDHIGERVEAEKVRFVERTDTGLAEATINAERSSADAEPLAELPGYPATGDQAVGGQRSGLVALQPGQNRKVVGRVERYQVNGMP